MEKKKEFETLTQLICEYVKAEAEFKNQKNIPEPIAPIRQKAYSIDDWNKYALDQRNYDNEKTRLIEAYKEAKQKYYELRDVVLSTLPTAHVWFLSEDNSFAIAIQKSDWPGSEPEILFVAKPNIDQLPELKLATSNFN